MADMADKWRIKQQVFLKIGETDRGTYYELANDR